MSDPSNLLPGLDGLAPSSEGSTSPACAVCSSSFYPRANLRDRQKTCGKPECKRVFKMGRQCAALKLKRDRNRPNRAISCAVCKSNFVPKAHQKTCGQRCSRARKNERLRAFKSRPDQKDKRRVYDAPRKLANALRDLHGISPGDFHKMADEQGGGCAICGSKNPRTRQSSRLAVDHDHKTGTIRGLLCIPCNAAIGMFGDDISRIASALTYLANPPHPWFTPCTITGRKKWGDRQVSKTLRDKLNKNSLTIEDFRRMETDQNGRCAICKSADPKNSSSKRLFIDHDHVTGKVRGLLCHMCNAGLGSFGDDAIRMRAAIGYLSRQMLGEANRRLPLIASDLRGPASVGKEAALCTPPLASFPCAHSAPSEASASLDGSPRRFDRFRPERPPEHQRPQLHRRHRQERPRLLRRRLPQLHHPRRYLRAESESAPSSSRLPRSWGSSWPSFTATQSRRI